jgi:hypothetical protein
VEIAIIQVLGNVEDEIKATKTKLCELFPTIVGNVFPTFLHAKKTFHMMPHLKNGKRPRITNWELNGE